MTTRNRVGGGNRAPKGRIKYIWRPSAVVVADRFVNPDLVDQRVRLDALPQVLPDRVVHGGDRPAGRNEPSVFLQAESPDAEGPLDFRDRQAVVEEVEDGLLRAEVRVGRGPAGVRID